MLAKRIIPTLLFRGTTLVKGKRFSGDRSVGHVLQAAKIHAARGVDELIMLDIGATPEGRGPNIDLVRQITAHAFTPITVGGGISTMEHVRELFEGGADKVSFKTALRGNPELVLSTAMRWGTQAVVASIDYDRGSDGVAMAKMAEQMGCGEVLLTDMTREGTMWGYDVPTIAATTKAVGIPVIAHGGCSGYEDMLKAIQAGASAVAAGALFQFTDATPRGAAQYLAEQGIEVRL